jgi:hypothetical protein
MADKFQVNRTAPTAGSGATKQLVAASSGNAVRLWQVVLAATVTDPLIFQDGSGGTTLLSVQVPANSPIVLPFTEAPWLSTTIGNGLFFNGLATTTVTAFYTIP